MEQKKYARRFKALTLDICLNIAKKFKTRHDFIVNAASQYQWIVHHHKLPELKKLFPPETYLNGYPKGHKFTLAECKKLAKEGKYFHVFRDKNCPAYLQAVKNGWMDKLEFKTKADFDLEQRKYTDKEIFEIASRYETPMDFQTHEPSAYSCASSYGLLSQIKYSGRRRETLSDASKLPDTIYAYEFPKTRTVYVGRSIRLKIRDNRHRQPGDSVREYADSVGLPVPEPRVLVYNISVLEGKAKEAECVRMYRELGWTLLNKATPGALGSINAGFLTHDYCIAIARKHSTLKELYEKDGSAYMKLRANGWIDECTWLKKMVKQCPEGSWNTCSKELVRQEAAKYTTLKDFRIANQAAYVRCTKEKWTWEFFTPPIDWKTATMEQIVEKAHEYVRANDFKRHSLVAYTRAKEAGLIPELFPASTRKPNPRAHRVIQRNPDGTVAAVHCSIKAAARAVGLPRDTGVIRNICRLGQKEKVYCGYRFEYEE